MSAPATIILHDAKTAEASAWNSGESMLYSAEDVLPCLGCFDCWVKTPGQCRLNDPFSRFAMRLAKADRLILISRLVFGSLSPEIKAVLDRSIGFVSPYFERIGKETHHRSRYDRAPVLDYRFYGSDLLAAERTTAVNIAQANGINLKAKEVKVRFFSSAKEAAEAAL